MPSPIVRHRARAFIRQSGLCFYCDYPMWDGDAKPFIKRYKLSRRQALQLQCTAEHLHARVDRGGDCQLNIVAACRVRNARRHRMKVARDPNEHRMYVQRRVHRGKWHAQWIFDKPDLAAVCRQGAGRDGEASGSLSGPTDPVGAALRTSESLKS